jgi:carboxyl-terminal processing protease
VLSSESTVFLFKRALVCGLLSVLVAGCVTSPVPERQVAAADPVRATVEPRSGSFTDPAVFRVGYARIRDIYLTPEDFGRLSRSGLAKLAEIDPAIGVDDTGGRIELRYAGVAIRSFDEPDGGDAYDWADVTADATDAAARVSDKLRKAGVEAAYSAVYDGVTGDLDPYSRYVDPDRARDDRASREGYSGIGIAIGEDPDGNLTIGDVFPGSPAARAGLARGERLVAVDGETIEGQTLDEVADRLRGPEGTPVSLTVASPEGVLKTAAMTREKVIQNVVTTQIRDDFAIVKVTRFNSATDVTVRGAIEGALHTLGAKARGVILDLRGNPGGLLSQAVDVADLFVDQGAIVSTRGRHPDSGQYYSARLEDIADDLPMAVLVDGHSASASEITAAALQDDQRAIVVGSSSFGKGSVQTVTRLPNDGELYLTWSRIYAPSGYTLHRQGVTPTVCTSTTTATTPETIVAAFREGRLPHPNDMIADRLAAPDSEAALRRLREACPWKTHDEDLDITVAIALLSDPALYAQAIAAQNPSPVALR